MIFCIKLLDITPMVSGQKISWVFLYLGRFWVILVHIYIYIFLNYQKTIWRFHLSFCTFYLTNFYCLPFLKHLALVIEATTKIEQAMMGILFYLYYNMFTCMYANWYIMWILPIFEDGWSAKIWLERGTCFWKRGWPL